MGEVISIADHLERKAAETDPQAIRTRLADIAIEMALLESEQARLKLVLTHER